jgi:hypothetical protein
MSTTETQHRICVVTSSEFQAQAAAMPKHTLDHCVEDNQKHEKDYLSYIAVKYSGRRMIPYGRWTCEDGRQVVFNREYQPMYSRVLGGESVFCDHAEFVQGIVKVEYFYGDHNSPVDYLLRKFSVTGAKLDAETSKACRNSLMICLKVAMENEPRASGNYNGTSWRALADSLQTY